MFGPRIARVAATAGSALLIVACGAAPAASPATAVPSPATAEPSPSPAATSPAATGAAATAAPTVDAAVAGFVPPTLRVSVGTAVRYSSSDTEHTVTHGRNGQADPGAAFDEPLPRGGTVSITFSTPGQIPVTCKIHPSMNQTVEVTQ